MFNLLKMDLRRLFKNRSFYIVMAVTAALIVMVSFMAALVSDQEMLDDMAAQGAEVDEVDRRLAEEIGKLNQLDLAHETVGGGFLLVMVGIGMTLFVHGDFSSGFVKNICCAKPRRADYVIAKALTAGVYSAVFTVLGAALILLSPYLCGMHPVPAPVPEILRYVFWLWLPHWAFALVLLTRSTTLGIVLSLVAGSGLTAVLLGTVVKLLRWPPLERYLLASVVNGIYVPQAGISQVGIVLICTVAWAAVYGIGSLLAMEKRDI